MRRCWIGPALDALVEGVRQDSYERLETTLNALLREYEAAKRVRQRAATAGHPCAGDPAKDRAELAAHGARTHEEKRDEKIE